MIWHHLIKRVKLFRCCEEDLSKPLGDVHIFVQIRLCTSLKFSPVLLKIA